MEISQERLEKFWKRWGFEGVVRNYPKGKTLWKAEGWCDWKSPALTMTNLFKYAIPAAKVTHISFHFDEGVVGANVNLYGENDECVVTEADTPALALFLALEKLKEVEG